MYDDYDLDYTFGNDYNLDEDTYYEYYAKLDVQELDEDYAHNTQDYDALAYKHYAWYDLAHTYAPIMLTHNKRLVSITLDIMCYDDLDLQDLNWRDLLHLHSDEDININIKEFEMEI